MSKCINAGSALGRDVFICFLIFILLLFAFVARVYVSRMRESRNAPSQYHSECTVCLRFRLLWAVAAGNVVVITATTRLVCIQLSTRDSETNRTIEANDC